MDFFFDPLIVKMSSSKKNGFSTKHWGKQTWRLIHLVCLNLPEEGVDRLRRQQHVDFFVSLSNVLPCRACRMEFKKMLRSNVLGINQARFKNRETAFRWSVKIHATVNKRLKKRYTNNITHWRRHYERMRTKSKKIK